MDSSERDETQETPISPSEPQATETPSAEDAQARAGQEVVPPRAEEPSVEPAVPPEPPMAPEPYEPPPPVEPAEPGIYYYTGEETGGVHTVLGEIKPGANDYSDVTHPDVLIAIAALVRDGVLTQGEAPPEDRESREPNAHGSQK